MGHQRCLKSAEAAAEIDLIMVELLIQPAGPRDVASEEEHSS